MHKLPRWVAAIGVTLVPPAVAAEGPGDLPVILILTIDTIRADHLGCYGYFRDTSPVIDTIAAESVLFERAISPVTTTLPSHTSLLTGTYPEEHGVLANVGAGGRRYVRNPALRTFAEVAGELGYRTGAVVSAAPLKRETGIADGFASFEQPDGEVRGAGETTDRALEWLRGRSEGPLLLWVHYFDPHYPYSAPAEFRDRYVPDDDLAQWLASVDCPDPIHHLGRIIGRREANNRYDGAIRYLDGQIGRLLDGLREMGLWERTILVLAGDHGESLGEHGEMAHGCIHGEQLRVPLMLRVPGLAPGRVTEPVSLVDALPTVLARLDPAGWEAFTSQSSGSDALASAATARPVLSQAARYGGRGHPFAYALTTASWKFEFEPDGDERLYRIATDPHELREVGAEHPDVANDLRLELLTRIALQRRRAAPAGELGDAPMDRAVLEQLRSLGYLD